MRDREIDYIRCLVITLYQLLALETAILIITVVMLAMVGESLSSILNMTSGIGVLLISFGLLIAPGIYFSNFMYAKIRTLGYEITYKEFSRYRKLLTKCHPDLPPKDQIAEIPEWNSDMELIRRFLEIKSQQKRELESEMWLKSILRERASKNSRMD